MLLAVRRLGHTVLLFPCCCRRSNDVTGFEGMRRWAAANPSAESERLLAKLCIQIAVNRMLRWVRMICCRTALVISAPCSCALQLQAAVAMQARCTHILAAAPAPPFSSLPCFAAPIVD